jgi:hypothetical protein
MSTTTRFTAQVILLLAGMVLSGPGCAPSFQGIRYRAQAPPVEDAFRSISLAITVDGYTVEQVDPGAFILESGWRTLKNNELSRVDTGDGRSVPEARLLLKMVRRGMLYDVMMTPQVRVLTANEATITVAPATHPLRIKWERVIARLIERESRDED